jgi:hypothetical protein
MRRDGQPSRRFLFWEGAGKVVFAVNVKDLAKHLALGCNLRVGWKKLSELFFAACSRTGG